MVLLVLFEGAASQDRISNWRDFKVASGSDFQEITKGFVAFSVLLITVNLFCSIKSEKQKNEC